ncbi:hypothetical protein [Granulicella tundricola]|uniref:Lipoprotein n=1 Tax=Granulicella tundricola (strain ATCC BAA-1859 / DSM 23138 / MP5ACTX9) TaxID=1198114 RepID=E8X438_GRATM|nr:hypothetical protein [Granulicella tundricola]ADW67098.1 hypothetical protein AciX9_0007 [Granulicella tundricola MP5ACTX9]
MKKLALVGLVLLMGCGPRLYSGKGVVAGSGGTLGNWSHPPAGCIRDSAYQDEGQRSVATFLWKDLRILEPGPGYNDIWKNDTPIRLDLQRDGDGYTGVLRTFKQQLGWRIDKTACSEFEFTPHEGPAREPKGRPVLDGELKMDCAVAGGRLTANVSFKGCGY